MMLAFLGLWLLFSLLQLVLPQSIPIEIQDFQCIKEGRFLYLEADGAGPMQLICEKSQDWLARGKFSNTINETGWSYLEIESNEKYPDGLQAYGAGFVEGVLSRRVTYWFWYNSRKDFCQGQEVLCGRINTYLVDNMAWLEQKILWEKDPYWHQAKLALDQIHGIVDGYNEARKKDPDADLPFIPFSEFLWMHISGDLEDLTTAFSPNQEVMTNPELHSARVLGSRWSSCSALVKLLPDFQDLFVSHVTWNTYQSMIRVLKKYTLPFHMTEDSKKRIPGHSVSFSSYPGMIYSGDDFHLISSGLVSLETTIGNSNPALWKYIKPEGQVGEWLRTVLANRLARTGEQWAEIFSRFNSGTYNNQWMVVDYKKFKPGKQLNEGALWVLEQLPGHVKYQDKTEVLTNQGYWPSYNTPYFPEIFNLSGSPKMVEKFGDWFTYDRTPRALIFKRDHNKVLDLQSMAQLMMYNDFTHDPLSHCNCTPPYSAENAISARNDLNPKNGVYPFPALGHRSHGGTDMKVTSSKLFPRLDYLAQGGPTYHNVPAFRWSEADFADDTPHLGHPDLWRFPIVHSNGNVSKIQL